MAVCSLLRPDDVPEAYRDLTTERDRNKAESGSCIIAPGGEVVAAASANEETILTATVSLEAVLRSKARLDVGGHYSRPDVLKLLVNRGPLERVLDMSHADSTNHGAVDVHTKDAFGVLEQETVWEKSQWAMLNLRSRDDSASRGIRLVRPLSAQAGI